MKKLSMRKAYNEMAEIVSEVFIQNHRLMPEGMDNIDDYLYFMEMKEGVDVDALMDASNELFHRIGVLPADRRLELNEELEYCSVHQNEHSGKCFVLFNHPFVMGRDDCGETVRIFGETQRKAIVEEEDGEGEDEDEGKGEIEELMRLLADGIKSGAIRSKSGEGYFVLKGEFYDAIAAGRKTTEYRDITSRNLSMSIGIKTVKLQRGYGHPGQPPAQMRFEVKSVTFMDSDDRECDPYNIPSGFIATTIAIHLGKMIG